MIGASDMQLLALLGLLGCSCLERALPHAFAAHTQSCLHITRQAGTLLSVQPALGTCIQAAARGMTARGLLQYPAHHQHCRHSFFIGWTNRPSTVLSLAPAWACATTLQGSRSRHCWGAGFKYASDMHIG